MILEVLSSSAFCFLGLEAEAVQAVKNKQGYVGGRVADHGPLVRHSRCTNQVRGEKKLLSRGLLRVLGWCSE